MPRPLIEPSSLDSKSNCNPRQIPKNDLPLLIQFLISIINSVLLRLLIAGSNEPTPGSINALQSFI